MGGSGGSVSNLFPMRSQTVKGIYMTMTSQADLGSLENINGDGANMRLDETKSFSVMSRQETSGDGTAGAPTPSAARSAEMTQIAELQRSVADLQKQIEDQRVNHEQE